VPVAVPTADLPLRDEPAVRPLLAVTAAALDPGLLDDPDTVEALLTSVGGGDGLVLRRLRRWLTARHRIVGADLLCRVVVAPALLAGAPDELARPVHRLVEVLRAGAQAAREPAASAQTVLWAVWQATGWPARWQAAALAGGRAGRRADRDLDAVLTLFEAAARFAIRLPASGPQEFLARLGDQDLPEDTLAGHAPSDAAVTLTTPQGAAGRQWALVVVAGVQEGVWPNTRLRGSLLGSTDLVDVLSGSQVGSGPADPTQQRAARREVLHDELRMFYVALTRASSRLLVTAVRNADQVPSPFLDLVDPSTVERIPLPAPRALSLPSVVAQLRVELDDALSAQTPGRAAHAANLLARLAGDGVAGADPRHWYGLAGWSDEAPLAVPGRAVRVTPSAIESFRDCPLRWLLDSSGARPPAPPAVGIGTVIHDISHELPLADADTLVAELRARWPELGIEAGWVSDRLLTRAEAMMIRLAGYRRTARLVASEVAFSVRIGEAVLSGRVDRLELDDRGRLVAVDIKTGSSAPTKAEVARHPQLGAYQLAVEAGAFADLVEGAAVCGGASLLQLGTGSKARSQPQPALADDPHPEWARDLVEQVASAMAGGDFPATVQPGCRHCPVRSSCPAQPEGRQVGS
jgi:RecB family exonuclease